MRRSTTRKAAEEKRAREKKTRPKVEEAIKNYERALAIAKARKKIGEKVSDQYIETLTRRIERLKKGEYNEKSLQRDVRDSEILLNGQMERLTYGRPLTKEEREKIREIEERKKQLRESKESELDEIKREFKKGLITPKEFERLYAQVAAYYDEQIYLAERRLRPSDKEMQAKLYELFEGSKRKKKRG